MVAHGQSPTTKNEFKGLLVNELSSKIHYSMDFGPPPNKCHYFGIPGPINFIIFGPWEMQFMGPGSLGKVGNELNDPIVDPMLRRGDYGQQGAEKLWWHIDTKHLKSNGVKKFHSHRPQEIRFPRP